ncbi:helix-turn-helix domain-containing protein [Bacillus norwichensis]|uniref:Helix-turn-helix transcriptional regulator n=1 Tax=Bacillus norwichensis TaxID=2762217 RepID=A0ABR8VKF8_9BACI|nr:helix-turn-helix transcriptional regulator [Bacillus norwichensis]
MAKGWSLKELSCKTGLNAIYLHHLENADRQNPSVKALYRLSTMLEVDMNYLITILIDEENGQEFSERYWRHRRYWLIFQYLFLLLKL